MKSEASEILLQKVVGAGTAAVGSITIWNEMQIEYGIYGSIFQICWIIASYMFFVKQGKKRELPPMYYAASAFLSFVLSLVLTVPIHDLLQTWINKDVSLILIAAIIGIGSEYLYEIVTGIKKLIGDLVPELRRRLAKMINPDSNGTN